MLTASIPNKVVIDQVSDYVDCSVFINNECVYRTTLYEHEGLATLYDLRSVIEDCMHNRQWCCAPFYIRVDYGQEGYEVTDTVYLVYSAVRPLGLTDAFFLSSRFLSTRRCVLAPRSCGLLIPYFTDIDDDCFITYDCRLLRNGQIVECVVDYPVQSPQAPDVYAAQADAEFVGMLCADAEGLDDAGKLLSATLRVGERCISVYYTDDRPVASFMFRNAFNAWEYMHVIGKDTLKTAVTRKEAICQGVMSFYDQSVEKKHAIETCPLTADEAAWYGEFLASRDIRLLERADNEDFTVVLTDITSEVPNDCEEPTLIKFAWRLADNTDWRKQASYPQIFNDTYNPTFQ